MRVVVKGVFEMRRRMEYSVQMAGYPPQIVSTLGGFRAAVRCCFPKRYFSLSTSPTYCSTPVEVIDYGGAGTRCYTCFVTPKM